MENFPTKVDLLEEQLRQQQAQLSAQAEKIRLLQETTSKRPPQRRLRAPFVLLLGLACALPFWSARGVRSAGIPSTDTLSYSGVLYDQGVPVDSATGVEIQVELWDALTGGQKQCETKRTVPVIKGNFRMVLVSGCVQAVRNQPDLYAQVVYKGNAVGGRNKLGAVPYAIEASHATNATNATTATNATNHFSKTEIQSSFYNKTESNNLFYTRNEIAQNYYNKTDVDNAINTQVSQLAARKGSCYVRWGAHGCTQGFDEVVRGYIGGHESYKTSNNAGGNVECVSATPAAGTYYSNYGNRLMRSLGNTQMQRVPEYCSICCTGGCYTVLGSTQCAAGYQRVYQGHTGGIEAYESGYLGKTLCVDGAPGATYTWGGYNMRLFRFAHDKALGTGTP